MNIAAPTFNALNKPQKRALILRDQLRFVDPQHLNGFLEGVSKNEPPTYTKVNGIIQPELTLVTLKAEATHFDLGNVLLPEEKNSVYRVHLLVENGHIDMRAEDPLPQDDDVLDSVPIHGFIAKGMVPLFRNKFHAIYSQMNKINGARRAAYDMANRAPTPVHDGETLIRLNPPKREQSQPALQLNPSGSYQVKQHVSNKRKRTGLDTITEDTKSRIFDTIPSNIKVNLFDSIVEAAIPNFDNVMMASWNVVSIYSACGSDFPDLHRSIVSLKSVLQDFDEAFGKRVNRETPKYRHDFCGHTQDDENRGGDGDCTPDEHRHDGRTRPISHVTVNNENAGEILDQSESSNTDQHISKQKDIATPNDGTEQTSDEEKPNISSPFQTPHPANPAEREEREITQDATQTPRLNSKSLVSMSPYNAAKLPSRKCLDTRSTTPHNGDLHKLLTNASHENGLHRLAASEDCRKNAYSRASVPLPAGYSARSTLAPRTSTSGTAPVANMVPNGEKKRDERGEE
ncbi:hypothetical protein COCMIDRAFT_102806 [Bipolaris oryzae ATCC 44560]|uniref:Uncharacterized protein n=1 Tax=Bipolaris oryzae ATCC 44560 TaxID=930090 RepID=W6Z568_COCMI|nr:uncharacterized protein COCMIDRAFT_102806 [Bipolaris oryzae ATCC 44560]EUC42699.1 hypothetical protein COCMIDRAFT_102806 [Bipolaris oryzae ATCC 44560]